VKIRTDLLGFGYIGVTINWDVLELKVILCLKKKALCLQIYQHFMQLHYLFFFDPLAIESSYFVFRVLA